MLEAVLAVRNKLLEEKPLSTESPISNDQIRKVADPVEKINQDIDVEVFISDFHLDRVREAFTWILNLSPNLLPSSGHINLRMHSVSSMVYELT